MNRRNFSKAAGLGVLGIGASAFGTAAASAGTAPQASTPKGKTNSPAESEKKQWAREHLRGLGSLVMPTFTADFKGLDEEGIRQDVRHRIRQGFCEKKDCDQIINHILESGNLSVGRGVKGVLMQVNGK